MILQEGSPGQRGGGRAGGGAVAAPASGSEESQVASLRPAPTHKQNARERKRLTPGFTKDTRVTCNPPEGGDPGTRKDEGRLPPTGQVPGKSTCGF